jgi:hypothetical protein
MRISTVLPFLFTLASALPQAGHPLQGRHLTERDVIVIRDGQPTVMDKATYHAENSHLTPPPNVNETHNEIRSLRPTSTSEGANIEKRCKKRDIYTLNPDQVFLNWDVPMSSVVRSLALNTTGTSPISPVTTVAVTAGYTIANELSVSQGFGYGIIEGFLSGTTTVSYSQSWTSSYTAAYTFQVPSGKYAVVVSNPSTTRRTGWVDTGCPGEAGNRIEYVGDSYESKAYGGLSWVDGIISLCTSDTYPVPNCVGSGTIS